MTFPHLGRHLDAANPTITLTGLTSGRTYTLYVNAVDEADHRGLANAPGVPFVPRPGLPSVGWTVNNANGNPGVVAGQQAVVQFTEFNPAFGPASYFAASVSTPPSLSPASPSAK